MTTMQRLEAWTRKHYYVSITTNGHVQPGDSWYVKLTGGGRTVEACESELQTFGEGDEEDYFPTCEDVIALALDRWEACREFKFYHVSLTVKPGAVFTSPDGFLNTEKRFPYLDHDTLWVQILATHEAAAIEIATASIAPGELMGPPYGVAEIAPPGRRS